ncbi:MAG: YggS family pyridoxal phosphate-dependent enzyme [Dysgonamonadaceae bacterium]|jgi:pyridoxal phosphate enzyme (YggS family)|nr:YggS family pyridoxal phosphate-dependent enzyme [Dysgonamonadaceae bacterium]
MVIADNLQKIKALLPATVRLAAVSKFHTEEAIMEAYGAGHRLFAENRVQELVIKYEHLPKDIEWHLIGHLQTNKVRQVVPFVSVIQSVDSKRILQEIERESQKLNRKIDIFLQIHIAQEEQKFGFSFDEAETLFKNNVHKTLNSVRITGLMGMATFTENKTQIRFEFAKLKVFFNKIKKIYFPCNEQFSELSMGMSGDYQNAVEEGSTTVRIGSAIFGERKNK